MSEGEFRERVMTLLARLEVVPLGSFERAELLDELHELVSEHLVESVMAFESRRTRSSFEPEA